MKIEKRTLFVVLAAALAAVIVGLIVYASGGNAVALADTASESGEVAESVAASSDTFTALGAALAIAVAALGGAIAMGIAISKAVEGISRQPEADGKIRSVLMLGLVFIETVVIYALIVAILIMFVV